MIITKEMREQSLAQVISGANDFNHADVALAYYDHYRENYGIISQADTAFELARTYMLLHRVNDAEKMLDKARACDDIAAREEDFLNIWIVRMLIERDFQSAELLLLRLDRFVSGDEVKDMKRNLFHARILLARGDKRALEAFTKLRRQLIDRADRNNWKWSQDVIFDDVIWGCMLASARFGSKEHFILLTQEVISGVVVWHAASAEMPRFTQFETSDRRARIADKMLQFPKLAGLIARFVRF